MPPKKPKPHDLKRRARRDLEDIWSFTNARWSQRQADAYLSELAAAIARIAADPEIARERAEYDPPVRIYRCKAHIIIYRDLGDRVSIVRIRHRAEDWMTDPEGADSEG